MKASELFARTTMHEVKKGRNVRWIGWCDGYILVRFQKPDLYIFGPDIPEGELSKILRVPYPDRQFQLAIRSKFRAFKGTV